jgi:hypothetical protein
VSDYPAPPPSAADLEARIRLALTLLARADDVDSATVQLVRDALLGRLG